MMGGGIHQVQGHSRERTGETGRGYLHFGGKGDGRARGGVSGWRHASRLRTARKNLLTTSVEKSTGKAAYAGVIKWNCCQRG